MHLEFGQMSVSEGNRLSMNRVDLIVRTQPSLFSPAERKIALIVLDCPGSPIPQLDQVLDFRLEIQRVDVVSVNLLHLSVGLR